MPRCLPRHEINIRPKVTATLKLQMAEPLTEMGKLVARCGERADEIIADSSFSDPLEAFDATVMSNLELVAQTLGDPSLEQALGVVQKWMALVSSSSEAIMLLNKDEASEDKMIILKRLLNEIEAFEFVTDTGHGLDTRYVMTPETTFRKLLGEAALSSQDSMQCV